MVKKKPEKGKFKGGSGAAMRELLEHAKSRAGRGQDTGKPHNKLSQPQNRWQRAVRYTWDKNRGRG